MSLSIVERPFVDMIVEEPANDEQRLVYADWLEEHGDIDRAELLRIELKLCDLLEPFQQSSFETFKQLMSRRAKLMLAIIGQPKRCRADEIRAACLPFQWHDSQWLDAIQIRYVAHLAVPTEDQKIGKLAAVKELMSLCSPGLMNAKVAVEGVPCELHDGLTLERIKMWWKERTAVLKWDYRENDGHLQVAIKRRSSSMKLGVQIMKGGDNMRWAREGSLIPPIANLELGFAPQSNSADSSDFINRFAAIDIKWMDKTPSIVQPLRNAISAQTPCWIAILDLSVACELVRTAQSYGKEFSSQFCFRPVDSNNDRPKSYPYPMEEEFDLS